VREGEGRREHAGADARRHRHGLGLADADVRRLGRPGLRPRSKRSRFRTSGPWRRTSTSSGRSSAAGDGRLDAVAASGDGAEFKEAFDREFNAVEDTGLLASLASAGLECPAR
jgi:hypothetical protein